MSWRTGIGVATLVATFGMTAHAAGAPEVYEKKCKLCHSIGGEGGKQAEKGGKLDGVGSKRDAAWLKAYIEDPKSKMPDAKMPKLKLAPDELDALVGYLSSLK
jgi:nitric oxide reductase subunit C